MDRTVIVRVDVDELGRVLVTVRNSPEPIRVGWGQRLEVAMSNLLSPGLAFDARLDDTE